MINFLSIIATILNLSGNMLLSKKTTIIYPMWIVGDLILIYVLLSTNINIPMLVMYSIYIISNIYNWKMWNCGDSKESK